MDLYTKIVNHLTPLYLELDFSKKMKSKFQITKNSKFIYEESNLFFTLDSFFKTLIKVQYIYKWNISKIDIEIDYIENKFTDNFSAYIDIFINEKFHLYYNIYLNEQEPYFFNKYISLSFSYYDYRECPKEVYYLERKSWKYSENSEIPLKEIENKQKAKKEIKQIMYAKNSKFQNCLTKQFKFINQCVSEEII